jgi:hypothetical protein
VGGALYGAGRDDFTLPYMARGTPDAFGHEGGVKRRIGLKVWPSEIAFDVPSGQRGMLNSKRQVTLHARGTVGCPFQRGVECRTLAGTGMSRLFPVVMGLVVASIAALGGDICQAIRNISNGDGQSTWEHLHIGMGGDLARWSIIRVGGLSTPHLGVAESGEEGQGDGRGSENYRLLLGCRGLTLDTR